MEGGWGEYFSLEDLTNAKCCASVHTRRTTEKNLIVGKSGAITFENVLADVSKEHLLDATSWREAILRMCEIIERYLPGKYSQVIAEQWRSHTNLLLNRTDFASRFPDYLAYDIRLRQAYVHEYGKFRPDEFQWLVWDAVKDEQRNKTLRSFEQTINGIRQSQFTTTPRPQSMSANFHYPTTNSTTSFRPPTTAYISTCAGEGRGSGTTRGGHSDPAAPCGKCWICRSIEHIPRHCPNSTNGFITKVPTANHGSHLPMSRFVSDSTAYMAAANSTASSCTDVLSADL